MSVSEVRDPLSSAQQDVLRRAASRAEAVGSVARGAFCALVLARFLVVQEPGNTATGQWGAVLNVGVLSTAIGYSVWVWRRAATGAVGGYVLAVSCVGDAVVCASSLLQTIWHPEIRVYAGILRQPDIAAQLVVIMTSALRLSPRLCVLSGALNGVFAAGLFAVDAALWPSTITYGMVEVSMFALLLGSVAFGAALLARQTRALVKAVATESARIERTRSHLALLAQSQHDAKSLLSAAALRVDRLVERTNAVDGTRVAHDIQRDLEDLRVQLEKLGESTHAELSLLAELSEVEVQEALYGAMPLLSRRFGALHVTLDAPEAARAHFVGGPEALQRVLYTLLVNAAQGDGVRCAQRVHISACVTPDGVVLRVEDDGPGFAFGNAAALPLTTKPHGQGLGLRLVRQLVEASGGQLQTGASRSLRGARVEMRLRTCRESHAAARSRGLA